MTNSFSRHRCARLARWRFPYARWAVLFAWLAALVSATSLAQTAPKLASVTPEDGATLVPTTATLSFVFDQEMDVSVPLFQTIPNVIAGNFEVTAPGFSQSLIPSWGADKRSFTLKAAIQFPYATFTWTLNPNGSLFPLKGKNGLPLATVTGTFSTGVGGTVPVLVAANPANDSTGVLLTAFVTFNFDQAMKTNTAIAGNPPSVPAAVSWSGAGLDPTKFKYSWSANGRSLLCDYVGDLPPNTEISWELNPAAAPVKLENPAGKVVPTGLYAGHFRTGSGIDCTPTTQPPATQGSYSLFKSSSFSQTPPADPVPTSEDQAFNFGAIVQGPQIGDAPTAGTLTGPSGTSTALTVIPGSSLQLFQFAATESELEATAPPGNYTFRFTLGTRPETSATMALPADNPPIPRIANLEAAQAIKADADFTLSWNAFTGAGPDDYLALSIFDDRGRLRFSAPDPCVPRELPVTATSIVIPAKSFATNSHLTATIVFNKVFYFSTNVVANMAGYGAIMRTTQFPLQTLGGGGVVTPPEPARLANPRQLPDGRPQFEVIGVAGSRHTVQRSPRLGSEANWSTVQALTLDASGRATAEDSQRPGGVPAFYRAQAE